MESYPFVHSHGLIGDMQTAALITDDGTLDWFCAPRFDSPSVFAGLIDVKKGGHFSVAPSDTQYVSRQIYLPGTPILITRFSTHDGVLEVIDFMPVAGDTPTDRHRLVRMIHVLRGTIRFRAQCQPRFNYAPSAASRGLPDLGDPVLVTLLADVGLPWSSEALQQMHWP